MFCVYTAFHVVCKRRRLKVRITLTKLFFEATIRVQAAVICSQASNTARIGDLIERVFFDFKE